MKKSNLLVVLSTVIFCLLITAGASAQNTLTYSTVDYDEETNTVYGYAYTYPDYAAGVYYQTAFVGAALKDSFNTMLVNSTKYCYGCRAELYLEASGNGNPPYTIMSGHYVFLSYYVYNYYDTYGHQYRSGYFDYYYYSYFEGPPGGPVLNFPIFFDFTGRNPPTVTPSINRFLGSLLSQYIGPSNSTIRYKTVKVDSTTRSFNSLTNNAELALNDTSGGSSYCSGSASHPFTLTLAFDLPDNTSEVFMDSRSFMHENTAKDQFSRMSSLQFSDMNLSSAPKSGKVSFSVFRKQPASNYPDNRVRVTIAGRISGGGSFSTTGRVKFTCP